MTQGSGFWDNQYGGDALSTTLFDSPYSSADRALWFSYLMASHGAAAYVFGGIEDSLEVTESAVLGMSVRIKTGVALIRGYMYRNDADASLVISAADATNPRIDLIVLELKPDTADQRCRLAVVTGTPNAIPTVPVLTQNASTFQVAIAEIWVAATTASITNDVIHDMRQYAPNWESMGGGSYPDNLIPNSEFLLLGANNGDVPGGFSAVGASNGHTQLGNIISAPTGVARQGGGLVVNPAASTTEYWGWVGNVYADGLIKGGQTYTFKCWLNCYTGNTSGSSVSVISDGTGPLNILKKYFRVDVWEEVEITFTVPADANAIVIKFQSLGLGLFTIVGPVMLVEGYYTGPWRAFHETIITNHPYKQYNASAQSTGTLTIALGGAGVGFAGRVRGTIRAFILYIEANDSGSAAGAPTVQINNNVDGPTLYLGGVPNDVKRSMQVMVIPTNYALGIHNLLIYVTATGAGTLDLTVGLAGVVT